MSEGETRKTTVTKRRAGAGTTQLGTRKGAPYDQSAQHLKAPNDGGTPCASSVQDVNSTTAESFTK